ncbi:MAG: quinolinate synthase NadA [Deltaproteobacteria bacterium]|nr:quinolinate synthase NadA [Deltaproteobacteria bacterium]NIS76098.1 quinolinate synthase NadA [Deltaproteobacteria bacterium]
MKMEDLKEKVGRVRELLHERNGLLLAHNYQRDEVQEIADVTGDSLGLSMEAARSDAEVIVFCGVHFMAESAAILSPDKKVILPRIEAGCPMADMVTGDDLREFRESNREHVVVTYVNSTAEVKAYTDICCTSANAISVVRHIPEDRKIFMVPDKNLALYVEKKSGRKLEWWDGYCPTHDRLTAEEVRKMKEAHPDAFVVVHPECRPDVVEMADHVCSTSGMYTYCRESAAKKFIIGTEMGILYRLRKENPDKEFYLASEVLICPNMKLTTIDDIIECLEGMKNIITVPEEIRVPAKKALDAMLGVPRDS